MICTALPCFHAFPGCVYKSIYTRVILFLSNKVCSLYGYSRPEFVLDEIEKKGWPWIYPVFFFFYKYPAFSPFVNSYFIGASTSWLLVLSRIKHFVWIHIDLKSTWISTCFMHILCQQSSLVLLNNQNENGICSLKLFVKTYVHSYTSFFFQKFLETKLHSYFYFETVYSLYLLWSPIFNFWK